MPGLKQGNAIGKGTAHHHLIFVEVNVYNERDILQFMCVGCWAGVTYLRYTVLTSPNKDKTAVHCCNGSCHGGVSKRVSCNISFAANCLCQEVNRPLGSKISVQTFLINGAHRELGRTF